MLNIARSIHKPIEIFESRCFCFIATGIFIIKHLGVQAASSNIFHKRMPPAQLVQSWNLCKLMCLWFYDKIGHSQEVVGHKANRVGFRKGVKYTEVINFLRSITLDLLNSCFLHISLKNCIKELQAMGFHS